MARKQDRRELFKDLKKGDLKPVYYIHGPDPYMLDAAVRAICEAAAPDGLNEFNHDKFRGKDASGDSIRAAAEQLPFMVRRRVVIIRDAQDLPNRELEPLKDYFDNPADTTVMIVHAMTAQKKLDGRNATVKKMRKAAAEYEFKAFYENELDEFLNREAARRNLSLQRGARAYLIEAVGTELSPLVDALERIDLYLGNSETRRNVEDDLVRNIIAETRVHSVFGLTDALGSRDFERSLKLLDSMLLAGESAIGILAMITRHFRILSRLKDPTLGRLNRNELARAVGVVPFFLKDYQRDAQRFTAAELESIRERIVHVDLALKSSRLADRLHLDGLMHGICFRETREAAR